MRSAHGGAHGENVCDRRPRRRISPRPPKGQSWWSEYNDVISQPFSQYLGYESAATLIRSYHPSLVPGQLQITDYITALWEVSEPTPRARRLIDMRLARQERVFQDGGPKVEMILDESALRRQIGGPGVMRRQLAHLKQLASGDQREATTSTRDRSWAPAAPAALSPTTTYSCSREPPSASRMRRTRVRPGLSVEERISTSRSAFCATLPP
ncbi:DUF5753 domain-containing protein [Streptomyces sp. NRRL WC-3618]|uniref:DUF5753 domain-containing protein n=1 Tax=Streptomyces sp. NRRL WC-3618 TaxID=1519490 RepID=UPI0018FEE67A|nr:DUF5753 domain-containing protein [Streptomyces sp. NRRL WC-3618]